MHNLNIVILAAGMGSRMRSRLPKVLHPIGGKSMIAHVLHTAKALEPYCIVAVVGHGADTVQKALAGEPLQFALQNPPKGTGHAVQQALPFLQNAERTLVLYGDVPLVQLDTLQAFLQTTPPDCIGVMTCVVSDPTGYGRIVRNTDGTVAKIVEHRDASDEERRLQEINTGILLVPNALLHRYVSQLQAKNAQGEYYLTDIIAMAHNDGVCVQPFVCAREWEVAGVNTRAQQAQLERQWQLLQAQSLMDQGVSLLDPARFDLRGSLHCGEDVLIDIGCVFEGQVVLGDGVSVGAHCVLRNVTIAAGTQIQPFSHISDAQIGAYAQIGPFARVRPGTVLSDYCRIGNFVELKKATIGAHSKVNHLSYVGDAQVGERVNIGAGVITCNYDGIHKHITTIGNDAFIGSDVQLVAPVHVGDGATIGAGTTVWKSVPE